MMIPSKVLIRGTQIAYYKICKTKLWLFSHYISMEFNSDLVKEGKLIHELSYSRENKEININNEIVIDVIKLRDGVEIKEIKKSPKLEDAHILQMKYYMYYLKKKGINVKKGVILYPEQRKIKEVYFGEEDEKEMMSILEDVKKIIVREIPPTPKYKTYCKKCAYYEFCFG